MIEKLPFGSVIKSFLNSNDAYRRFKYSETGLKIWRWFATPQSMIINQEDRFYRNLLSTLRSGHFPILDIGANAGWITKTFLNYSKCVVSVEPDDFSLWILQNRFDQRENFHLVAKAVSAAVGYKKLLIQEPGSSLNTFSKKWQRELESGFFFQPFSFSTSKVVPTTTLDALIRKYGLPALIKIDVEGHELEVVKGLSQSIPLLVFEANLPVFLQETLQVLERLFLLDKQVRFNYADNQEVKSEEYVTHLELAAIIKGLGKSSIDIICRMSNYHEFFKN